MERNVQVVVLSDKLYIIKKNLACKIPLNPLFMRDLLHVASLLALKIYVYTRVLL